MNHGRRSSLVHDRGAVDKVAVSEALSLVNREGNRGPSIEAVRLAMPDKSARDVAGTRGQPQQLGLLGLADSADANVKDLHGRVIHHVPVPSAERVLKIATHPRMLDTLTDVDNYRVLLAEISKLELPLEDCVCRRDALFVQRSPRFIGDGRKEALEFLRR